MAHIHIDEWIKEQRGNLEHLPAYLSKTVLDNVLIHQQFNTHQQYLALLYQCLFHENQKVVAIALKSIGQFTAVSAGSNPTINLDRQICINQITETLIKAHEILASRSKAYLQDLTLQHLNSRFPDEKESIYKKMQLASDLVNASIVPCKQERAANPELEIKYYRDSLAKMTNIANDMTTTLKQQRNPISDNLLLGLAIVGSLIGVGIIPTAIAAIYSKKNNGTFCFWKSTAGRGVLHQFDKTATELNIKSTKAIKP